MLWHSFATPLELFAFIGMRWSNFQRHFSTPVANIRERSEHRLPFPVNITECVRAVRMTLWNTLASSSTYLIMTMTKKLKWRGKVSKCVETFSQVTGLEIRLKWHILVSKMSDTTGTVFLYLRLILGTPKTVFYSFNAVLVVSTVEWQCSHAQKSLKNHQNVFEIAHLFL